MSKIYNVRLPDALMARYKFACEQDEMKHTDVIRFLMREYADGRIRIHAQSMMAEKSPTPTLKDMLS